MWNNLLFCHSCDYNGLHYVLPTSDLHLNIWLCRIDLYRLNEIRYSIGTSPLSIVVKGGWTLTNMFSPLHSVCSNLKAEMTHTYARRCVVHRNTSPFDTVLGIQTQACFYLCYALIWNCLRGKQISGWCFNKASVML